MFPNTRIIAQELMLKAKVFHRLHRGILHLPRTLVPNFEAGGVIYNVWLNIMQCASSKCDDPPNLAGGLFCCPTKTGFPCTLCNFPNPHWPPAAAPVWGCTACPFQFRSNRKSALGLSATQGKAVPHPLIWTAHCFCPPLYNQIYVVLHWMHNGGALMGQHKNMYKLR